MTRVQSLTLAFVSFGIVVALSVPSTAQFAQISFPNNGTVVSGTALIIATQLNTVIDPALTSSVVFQYSPDGVTWYAIDSDQGSVGNTTNSQSPRDWQVQWDTTQVASGPYLVRAQFYYPTVNVLVSTSAVSLTVNLPPVAIATGSISSGGLAQFSGASSYDPDGSIVSWTWDFGDGVTGSGPFVTHTYSPGRYVAVLTVIDNLGAQAAAYLDVDTTTLAVNNSTECIGTNIALGTTGNAVGSDGKGSGWPPRKTVDDGKTRGPMQNNPGNTGKDWWGYAFEIVVDVKGNPDLCREIQIIKGTYKTAPGDLSEQLCARRPGGVYDNKTKVCTFYSGWTGLSNDFNGDGILDLDVSTPDKCKAQNGFWYESRNVCLNAAFPIDGNNWKPDEDGNNRGAYRKPYAMKSHVGQQILWWDTPMVSATDYKAGFTGEAQFVAIIRGTDDLYCYAWFSVDFEVGKASSEDAGEIESSCGVMKSGVIGLK